MENGRPTACYFQWNSWKLWSLIFRYWYIFMLVSKFCDFLRRAIFSRFSNFQNCYFIDFWLGSWRLRGRKNVSVGHETSILSIEKLLASSFSSRVLFLFLNLDFQTSLRSVRFLFRKKELNSKIILSWAPILWKPWSRLWE